MLTWDVKAGSGNVILNLDTEDEQTLPIQISEQMNPENRMEILANGLQLMEAHTYESILPNEAEFEPDTTTNIGVIAKKGISNVTTSGRMTPTDASPNPSHPFYQGTSRINITRKLNGRARLNLAEDNPYQRHIWVRLLTRNSNLKWKIMGWAHANKSNNGFNFVIPEPYDQDLTGNDYKTTNITDVQKTGPFPFIHPNGTVSVFDRITTTYSRPFMADAWSGDGTRANFAWVELSVKVSVKKFRGGGTAVPNPVVPIPPPPLPGF
ncbi:MAG: hypothetical protein V3U87_00845 [Methylococcaceae bacterium]